MTGKRRIKGECNKPSIGVQERIHRRDKKGNTAQSDAHWGYGGEGKGSFALPNYVERNNDRKSLIDSRMGDGGLEGT